MIIVPETGKVIPVGDGSPVTIKVGDNVTAASYTNITIRCPISGVPTPKVNWLKDDVPIVEGEAFSITSDYHLVLKDLEAEHIAKYTCMAKSEFGTDEISSIVQIIGKLFHRKTASYLLFLTRSRLSQNEGTRFLKSNMFLVSDQLRML